MKEFPSLASIRLVAVLFVSIAFTSCTTHNQADYHAKADNAAFLNRTMKQLTDVIVHDIFSPPLASRVYVYPAIAAYESIVPFSENYKSYAGQLNGLTAGPQPDPEKEYVKELASLKAFLIVGKELVFSEYMIDDFEKEILNEFRSMGIPGDVFDRSIGFGEAVAKHILDWAGKDGYKESRTMARYTPQKETGKWSPTPPDFMDAIEPNWNTLRTFVLDSAQQFVPAAATPFSMEEGSQFYREVMEVYDSTINLDDEGEEIARFWDCNPFSIEHKGHLMIGTKKITPGGHWIGITGIATKVAKSDFDQTAEAYSLVSIALADAFISCWDEKYRSNLIRPETVINAHLDPEWKPLLQTPPFPEYTSGHSVISAAAATALTHLYGGSFSFIDSVELEYGLPVRSFDSFKEASEEAAISRLYGGIHYMPAIKNGVDQGVQVGRYIIANVNTKASS